MMERPYRGAHLDTPMQVAQLCKDGVLGDVSAYKDWVAIRDSVKLVSKPVWLSDFAVKAAEDWAIKNNAIVWCGHAAVDRQDEEEIDLGFKRIPYFGAGQGRELSKFKGPCAASIRANGTGLNLQHFDKALIMVMPSSGATMEQLLARHHREGQKADMVEFYFFAHTQELVQAINTVMKDAQFAEDTLGTPQRALKAAWLDDQEHNLDLAKLFEEAV
jgi:hypothetical protein